MSEFYDREGQPLDMWGWAELRERNDEAYWRVDLTVADGWEVSTVWMGVNHRFIGPGAPLIFETMVFCTDAARRGDDLKCVRYSTETEARIGHEIVVDFMRRGGLVDEALAEINAAIERVRSEETTT